MGKAIFEMTKDELEEEARRLEHKINRADTVDIENAYMARYDAVQMRLDDIRWAEYDEEEGRER